MSLHLGKLTSAIALLLLPMAASAETQMERALAEGADRLTADQVASRLADKTVTFETAHTGETALIYYDGENGTRLKFPNGEVLDGFYAFDLADHVCLGVYGDMPMRLRCLHVLLIDDVMHKFELDGSLRGKVIEEVRGNVI